MDLFDGQPGFEQKFDKPEGILRDDVRFIFEHWKKVMKKNKKTSLDARRKTKIVEAVRLYGDVQYLCRAIDGCTLDDWYYKGKNDRKTVYTDITTIFKNAKNIEYFAELAEAHEQKKKNSGKIAAKVMKEPWEIEGITWAEWFEKTYGKKAEVPADILKRFKIKVDITGGNDTIAG